MQNSSISPGSDSSSSPPAPGPADLPAWGWQLSKRVEAIEESLRVVDESLRDVRDLAKETEGYVTAMRQEAVAERREQHRQLLFVGVVSAITGVVVAVATVLVLLGHL